MYPYIHIFGKTMSSYTVCGGIGIGFLFIYAALRCREEKRSDYDMYLMIVTGLITGYIGAVILYQLTQWNYFCSILPLLFTDIRQFAAQWNSGIVFYGGFIGAVFGCGLYAKISHSSVKDCFRMVAPGFALFHAIGRVGCFLVGCCHGAESERFGIAFTNSFVAKNGIPYLPVPLYEAAGNIIIFLVLHLLRKRVRNVSTTFGIYAVSYGTMRFILEFFRGDEIRGIYGFLSTSQWISLVLIPFGIYCLLCPEEKNLLAMWLSAKPRSKKA